MTKQQTLNNKIIEKASIVGKCFSTKKINGKEYRYKYGIIHVKVPPEWIGKKVRVTITLID